MAGNLTPVQLHDLAVTLENEQAFYHDYRAESDQPVNYQIVDGVMSAVAGVAA